LQRGMNTIWLSKNIVIQNITEKISSKIINVNEKFLLCCSTNTALKLCKKRDPSLVYKQAKALSLLSTLFMTTHVCVTYLKYSEISRCVVKHPQYIHTNNSQSCCSIQLLIIVSQSILCMKHYNGRSRATWKIIRTN
jgi:hypothetical protein